MQILRNDKLNADYKDQIRLDLWCSSKYADQTNMKTVAVKSSRNVFKFETHVFGCKRNSCKHYNNLDFRQ